MLNMHIYVHTYIRTRVDYVMHMVKVKLKA